MDHAIRFIFETVGKYMILAASSISGLLLVVPSAINTVRSAHVHPHLQWPKFHTAKPFVQLQQTLAWLDMSDGWAKSVHGWLVEPRHVPVLTGSSALIILIAIIRSFHLAPKQESIAPAFGWAGIAVLAEVGQPVWAILIIAVLSLLVLLALIALWGRFFDRDNYGNDERDEFQTRAMFVAFDFLAALVLWPFILGARLVGV